MWTEPRTEHRPEQPYAAIRVRVPMNRLGEVVPPLNAEVFGWLAAHGGSPAGAPFWKYNVIDMQAELEIEAGVAVVDPLAGDDRVICSVLPAGTYATLVHTGHPQELADATAALLAWGADHGVTWDAGPDPDGERWTARLEFYRTDPAVEPDMSVWETELAILTADTPTPPAT